MMETWRRGVILVFLASVVLCGLFGTSSSMTFVWPAYALLGLAGALSVGLFFRRAFYSLPLWLAGSALAGLLLFLVLAWRSPVAYLARADLALGAAAFLVYGLFLALLTGAGSRRRFVEALALLALVNLVFAALQSTLHPTLWILPGYERTFADRIGGLFNHPDHFAAFLAMLTPLWAALALLGRSTLPVRLSFAALALASVSAALLSGSPAASLGLAAGAVAFASLLWLLLRPRLHPEAKRTVLRAVGGAALLVALGALALSGPIGRLLDRNLLTKANGLRLPLVWSSGWRQFADSPVLGTGSRSSEIHARLHRHEALAATAQPEFLHNEYLQALADYGLVGFAVLLLLVGLHFAYGLRFVGAYAGVTTPPGTLFPRSDHLALVVGALGSLTALALLSGFDFILHLPVFPISAAALLATLAVPDPMAEALKPPPATRLLPVGGVLLAKRALVFTGGLSMMLLGVRFAQSEYHYEMAKLAFEVEPGGLRHRNPLREVRSLDARHPWALALSGHAEVASIHADMPEPERLQALQRAEGHFERARRLHPADPFAAIGHAAVLEELGRPREALARLRDARKAEPHHGRLILAEAEHHLRNGRVVEAEASFRAAVNARAYRDIAAAQRGLRTVTEWKLIAESRGIDWRVPPDPLESEPLLAGETDRRPPEARVAGVELAGRAEADAGEKSGDAKEVPEAPSSGPTSDPASHSDPTSAPASEAPPKAETARDRYEELFVPLEFTPLESPSFEFGSPEFPPLPLGGR